jgi:hypothetical protein
MAVKTLYFRSSANGIPVTGNWTLSETIGGATENTSTNHTGSSVANVVLLKPGVSQGASALTTVDTTAPPLTANRFGWFSDVSYNGSFASGTWSFQHEHDDNRSATTGSPVVNVYKCTSQDFAGTFTFLFQINTGQDWWTGATGTQTFTTGSQSLITLSSEFLFVNVWCNETVSSTARSHNFHTEGNVNASVSKIVTPNFTPAGGVVVAPQLMLTGVGI